jgi:glutaredoxin-like protein NrdH
MEAVTELMPRETEVTIVLYSQPGCVQCDAIKRKFKLEKLVEGEDFTVVDVSLPENVGDYEAIKALDYMRVPVTFVNDDHFGGYDINKVADAIARRKRTKMHVVETEAAVA